MLLIYSVLVGLAAYRAWRILALDTFTEGFRDWLTDKGDDSTAWTWVGDLILCPWCWGWWLAAAGAYIVSDWQDYGPVEFALLALVGSTICGATHHVIERIKG